MQPLDYETPQKPKRKSWPFWLAFFIAYYIPGLVMLSIADDLLHRRLGHGGTDGGVELISLLLSPLFAGGAAAMKSFFPRYNTIAFAIVFGTFGPVSLLLILLLLILFA